MGPLDYPFMVHALLGGAAVAVAGALVGWFVVARRQAFAAHTLSVMAFPGASAAALAGAPLAAGYLVACVTGAVAIAAGTRGTPPGSRAQETAVVGSVQAAGLAVGFLLLSLYGGVLENLDALLFGSFLGISADDVLVLWAVTGAAGAFLAVAGRPLLFGTVDPEGARAAGVPVSALSAAFLVVCGLAVAATAQITGALLVFALLVAPAAAAQRLVSSPAAGISLSLLLGLAMVWAGLLAAYYSGWPVGFWVTSIALAVYVGAGWARARA